MNSNKEEQDTPAIICMAPYRKASGAIPIIRHKPAIIIHCNIISPSEPCHFPISKIKRCHPLLLSYDYSLAKPPVFQPDSIRTTLKRKGRSRLPVTQNRPYAWEKAGKSRPCASNTPANLCTALWNDRVAPFRSTISFGHSG